jgi:hypothetical protein
MPGVFSMFLMHVRDMLFGVIRVARLDRSSDQSGLAYISGAVAQVVFVMHVEVARTT